MGLDTADDAAVYKIIDDTEPKFGLAVTGLIHPQKILSNASAKPGDALILTKPIGLGIITTAIKRGMADEGTVQQAIEIMSTLNMCAAATLANFPVNACTDVTGFGLLGHLSGMTAASGVDAEIYSDKVPILDQAREFAVANVVPGGSQNNLEFVSDKVEWTREVSSIQQVLLCDAQTSGGLLIATPEKNASDLLTKLYENGVSDSALIGKITKQGKGKIVVK